MNHNFKKKFGQNFLTSSRFPKLIVSALNILQDELILEVGPGDGSLTKELVKTNAVVKSIEIDYDLIVRLIKQFEDFSNFTLINEDFLNTDLKAVCEGNFTKVKVTGSLPYNISKQIIDKTLKANTLELNNSKIKIESAVFIVQEEVAKLYAAKAPKATFLSAYSSIFATVKKLESIPASQFFPKPKVNGGIVQFSFNKNVPKEWERSTQFLKQLFIQPRKTLYNNIRNIKNFDKDVIFEHAKKHEISLSLRASEVTPEKLLSLLPEVN